VADVKTELCRAKTLGEPPWYLGSPCSRAAKRDGYCTIHHPDTVTARRAKASAEAKARWDAKQAIERRKWDRPKEYRDALRAIAAGHNDPRALAQEMLAKWNDTVEEG
jgi:hypothetical protein